MQLVFAVINIVSSNREFMATTELSIKGCLRVIVPVRSKHLFLFFVFLISSALLC